MIIIVFAFILCILLLDFTIVGFLPSKLGIWTSLKDLITGDILIEDSAYLSVQTDIKGKYVDSMINQRVGYKSLILTKGFLIVKNTYLTSLLNIKTDSIKRITTKKALLGKKLILYLEINNEDKYFNSTQKKLMNGLMRFRK